KCIGSGISQELKVVVSDLTYVRVAQKWHYICVLIDFYNRKIIGYSAGPQKTAALVQRAFASVPYNPNRLEFFHTDHGSEFKNTILYYLSFYELIHMQRICSK